jgi:hypothetical protein
MTTIIFKWGYHGWGNHTSDLVESVATVETSRGSRPPIVVDIRIKRSVRAVGFTGPLGIKIYSDYVLNQRRSRWI